ARALLGQEDAAEGRLGTVLEQDMLFLLVEIGDERLELFVGRRSQVEDALVGGEILGHITVLCGWGRPYHGSCPRAAKSAAGGKLDRGVGRRRDPVRGPIWSRSRRSAAPGARAANERRRDRPDRSRLRTSPGRP